MYDLAKKARAGMKSKAERLAGEKDRKTDSSDWSPAEPLNADVKTGMRPVSRRAYKDGGKVAGSAPKGRADRKPRKAGGKVEAKGEQPLVDRYVNRDLKKANEYRDGKKHIGGLKTGGRAGKLSGGALKRYTEKANEDQDWREGMLGSMGRDLEGHMFDAKQKWKMKKREKGVELAEEKLERKGWKRDPDSGNYEPPKDKDDKDGKAHGGRAKKEIGGAIDAIASGKVKGLIPTVMGTMDKDKDGKSGGLLKNGGRAHKAVGGEAPAEKVDMTFRSGKKPGVEFNKPYPVPTPRARPANLTPAANNKIKPDPSKYLPGDVITGPPKYKEMPLPRGSKPKYENMPLPRDFKPTYENMKSGGRMKRADGGSTKKLAWNMSAAEMLESSRKRQEDVKKGVEESKKKYPGMSAIERAEQSIKDKFTPAYFANLKKEKEKEKDSDEGYKEFADRRAKRDSDADEKRNGGRAKKADGGPMMMDPRLGIVKPKAMEFGQNVVTPGLKKGGRIAKQIGGALGRGLASAAMGAMNRPMTQQPPIGSNPAMMGRGPAPQAMANAQGRPFQPGGRFAPPPSPSSPLPPMTGTASPLTQTGAMSNLAGMQPYAAPLPSMTDFNQQLASRTPITSGLSSTPLTQEALMRQAQLATMSPQDQFAFNAQQAAASGNPYPAGASFESSLGPQGITVPMTYANGGRIARALGGETKAKPKGKGKTNINIVIATGKQQQPQSMVPDVNAAPMGPQGIPVPTPAPTAPMGVPPVPAAPMMGGPAPSGPMTPPSPMMPPMPRRAGGRVSKVAKSFKDMTAGAGSGEGRLQKTDIAKRAPHKAGGKVYRSYKDMDAGAGSGKGRLEKTEIQTRKK